MQWRVLALSRARVDLGLQFQNAAQKREREIVPYGHMKDTVLLNGVAEINVLR